MMFSHRHNSSSALLFAPIRRRSTSSPSSSAFSSQHFTQSDTEAEDEKRFLMKRRVVPTAQRRVVTPNALMLDRGRRREVVVASCSTPKSSQEDLLLLENGRPVLDETSVYFRPRRRERPKQQMLINDYYCCTVRRRNALGAIGNGNNAPKTPMQLRRSKRQKSGKQRRHNSNPMLAFLAADDELPRCSSPILLDFRPESEQRVSGDSPPLSYALLKRVKKAKEREQQQQLQQYTNLPLAAVGNSGNGKGPMQRGNSNSDSGMEEKVDEDDDGRTQFVNMSSVDEKLYENLPPLAAPPLPPIAAIPPNPPPVRQPLMPMAEDFPALYAHLAALALTQARSANIDARRLHSAQRQLADLVGLRMTRTVELAAGGESADACFERKCAEFSSQLAQRLRCTETQSRKEFNWQVKKLQKILHQLRAEEPGPSAEGTLHRLFRRVFRK